MDFEAKKAMRAKKILNSLLEGKNPSSGEDLTDNDSANNASVYWCLLYIADLLSEVIQNGGVQVRRSDKKVFSPSMLDYAKFEFSDKPISMSEFVRRVNDCAPPGMQRLSNACLVDWLVDERYLEQQTIDELKYTRLGERYKEIGLILCKKKLNNGTVSFVGYPRKAQLFLLAHLLVIFENYVFEDRKAKGWTKDELLFLEYAWKSNVDVSVIAQKLHRTKSEVRVQIEKNFVGNTATVTQYNPKQKAPLDSLSKILKSFELTE